MSRYVITRFFSTLALLSFSATVAAAENKDAPLPPDVPMVECKPPAAFDFSGLRVFNGTAPVLMAFHCGDKGSDAAACHAEYLDLAKLEIYQGDLIAPGTTQGRWTCAMVGGWSGWIPSDGAGEEEVHTEATAGIHGQHADFADRP